MRAAHRLVVGRGARASAHSTFFLMGPMRQLKYMFQETRWIASLLFIGSVVFTLVAAFVVRPDGAGRSHDAALPRPNNAPAPR